MTINCKGKLIDLGTPRIMGILNTTPDSFFDGGKYTNETILLKHVENMLQEGATFIDIGGYSSRPGADHITQEEEIKRVIPIIELLRYHFPEIIISIDTFRSEVAKKAINSGASLINDISGGTLDTKMFETVAQLQVPYILMHIKGTPQNMQKNPSYEDIVVEINQYFAQKVSQLRQLGVHDIILDAGFGFGKTIDHNYEILRNHHAIGFDSLPTLVGISRKSMIYKPLNSTPQESLNGTTILNTIALQKSASILRVHDVKEAKECIQLVKGFDL
ncbi:dihydropteroate synthase [Flavobacteriaceae bacterium UJ101]|nr:dihydropteroate synthase [Flavobacteriaceae bacterium UJ101]